MWKQLFYPNGLFLIIWSYGKKGYFPTANICAMAFHKKLILIDSLIYSFVNIIEYLNDCNYCIERNCIGPVTCTYTTLGITWYHFIHNI